MDEIEIGEARARARMGRDDILGKLRERIVAFAASRLAGEAAQDLAQEVLMVLHNKYAHVERLDDLLPLSLQIMRFKLAAWRRKTARRGEGGYVQVDEMPLPDPGPSPLTQAEKRELLDRMKQALATMGEGCREIFRLKLLGKTFPEIQHHLGAASLNTVYTWDSRCRKELAQRMGGSWDPPEKKR